MILLLAAALPLLYWDGPENTAAAIRAAHVTRMAVPAENLASWTAIEGVQVEPADVNKLIRLPVPTVKYRMQVSGPTGEPWVDTNAWRLIRQPGARFYYDAPGASAQVAAAEAFMWGASALVHTDDGGIAPLTDMVSFLAAMPAATLPARANIGFVDDGSGVAGEVMKLMIRRNLLFRTVSKPDPALDLNVELGSKQYPRDQASDPYFLAQKIRGDLGDDKRLVRVFGSEVTVARLAADANHGRLHLLNYAAPRRPAVGIRVYVKGPYRRAQATIYGQPNAELKDVVATASGLEFTIPQLDVYGVIDLFQ